MIELAAAWMRRDPAGKSLLAAYDEAEPEAAPLATIGGGPHSSRVTPTPGDAGGGWVPRLRKAEGVSPDDLSRVHGKLIAFGFLEFDLAGRAAGVRYRVSRQGRAVLRGDFDQWRDDERDDCREESRETASVAGNG
ncbi:MAG: hypothetical protein WD066_14800 [Planctomycetaceae bacterium]